MPEEAEFMGQEEAEGNPSLMQTVGMLNKRPVAFQIEGFESADWKDQYINGQDISQYKQPQKKEEESDLSSGEELWEEGSEGFEDDSEDSEGFGDILNHENNITKNIWLP